LWQSLAGIALAALGLAAWDKLAAKSILLGAYCVILPHCLFTWYVFRFRGAVEPDLVLKSVYRGETLKFLTLALLVATALKHAEMIPWLFFGGLVVALIMQALLPILINYDNWD
jgi:ATP synthase protein I